MMQLLMEGGAALKSAGKVIDISVNLGEATADILKGKSPKKSFSRADSNFKESIKNVGKAVENTVEATHYATIGLLLPVTSKVLDGILHNEKRLYSELFRVEKRVIKQINISGREIGEVLKYVSQPKNIFKIALIYVASQIMGPYGAALVNTLYDKYILEKKMDFEEMLISFGVGAAAGYAAEGAHSLVAGTTEAKNFMDHSSYLAKASARLAQDVVADVGNAVLNEDKYSSKDFFESLAMALGSVEIGNNVSAQIMESTLEGATKSAASQIVREDFNFSKIDMQKIENGLYEGAANGITREAVHELVDIVLIDNLPEDYKRIDKKINKKISDILYDAFSSDPKFQENLSLRLIYEELEGLEEDKKEELVNLIDKEGKLALERSANKINKNSKDLTIEDFNNPIFINELKKQESIIIERLSENDLILNISTGSEVIEKRRAPSAALLPLVLGVAALGSMVLSIQEVHDIYIMSEGEKRNNAALNLAQTEGGFLLLGALLGPAVVGGKAAYKVGSKIFSKFKKVFNPSFNIINSARKLGLKTKEGIAKLAKIKQSKNASKGLSGAAKHDFYKKQLRSSMAKPKVQNRNLKQIIEDNYRPNAKIGSGSTADALRHEKLTGNPVGGKRHAIKSRQQVKRIDSWLKANKNASSTDRAAAEQVMLDMMEALGDI